MTSESGVGCVECGGASCGEGCAGKGMSMLFSKLEDIEADYRVCDVMGDVVCGGFSYPMRKGNVDAVILVTSGEFMSLYALNNILRGMRNVNGGRCVLGIVFNRRGDDGEEEMARRYSDASGIPIICDIPRDGLFAEAESMGRTLLEAFPGSETRGYSTDDRPHIIQGEKWNPHPLRGVHDGTAAGREITSGKEDPKETRMPPRVLRPRTNLTFNDNFLLPSCTSTVRLMRDEVYDLAIILHGPPNFAQPHGVRLQTQFT